MTRRSNDKASLSLADYPLYSDDDHSELERETADEAWSEAYGGRRDFAKALAKHLDDIDDEHEHDLDDERYHEALDALWYDCTERFCGGASFLNESGSSIHFPINSVINRIAHDWPGINDPRRPSILVQIATLATLSRVNPTKES